MFLEDTVDAGLNQIYEHPYISVLCIAALFGILNILTIHWLHREGNEFAQVWPDLAA